VFFRIENSGILIFPGVDSGSKGKVKEWEL
jgi:hypothetical protein